MVEDFNKIVEDLDGTAFLDSNFDKKVVNFDEAKNYFINLDELETGLRQVETQQADTIESWHNLDVRFIDIINSFIATSERPVFFIRDDKLVYMNQAAVTSYEIQSDKDFIGNNFFNLIVKEDWELLSKNIGEMITDSKEVIVRIKNNKDKVIPAKLRAIYLPESDHFSFILMGEHKANKNKFSYSNLYDELTGLPNFFLFEDRVEVAIVNENAKEKIEDVCSIAVVAINIDNIDFFKKLQTADIVISRVAEALALSLPKTATIAVGLKYSFWVMLKTRKEEELRSCLNLILEVLKKGVSDNFARHEILFSMGISCFPQKTRSSKKIMEQALLALEANQKNETMPYNFYEEDI